LDWSKFLVRKNKLFFESSSVAMMILSNYHLRLD